MLKLARDWLDQHHVRSCGNLLPPLEILMTTSPARAINGLSAQISPSSDAEDGGKGEMQRETTGAWSK